MTADTSLTGDKDLDSDEASNRRRRKTDIVQPLDYVARELVSSFIQNQRAETPPHKVSIKKLLSLD